MTAMEIHSIVAFCKKLSGSGLSKIKHQRIIDNLNSTKLSVSRAESRQNTHLETDAAVGSNKPGASDSLILRLESKPLPPEEF